MRIDRVHDLRRRICLCVGDSARPFAGVSPVPGCADWLETHTPRIPLASAERRANCVPGIARTEAPPRTNEMGSASRGGLFLLYLAATTYRQWKGQPGGTANEGSAPRTLLQAATVNILNPNPYLGWSLVLGPEVLKAWRHSPASAVALITAFYATMISSLAVIILLFSTTRFLGPRGRRALVLVSAAALAALGLYLLAAGTSMAVPFGS